MGQARARSSKMGSSVSPAILAREFVQQFRQCRGALIALLGRDAGGLSASTIGRLKEAWSEEHSRWSKRDLSAKRYIYFWVDGIHVQARLEDTAQYQEGCACRLRRLRRDLGPQIRQGGRVPDQGSRCAARLLQLPGRAVEAPAHGVRFRDVNARTRPDRG